jgi:hypothetical protein
LYLKDVLQFYELDEAQKLHKQAQGARLPRGLQVLHMEAQHIFLMQQIML